MRSLEQIRADCAFYYSADYDGDEETIIDRIFDDALEAVTALERIRALIEDARRFAALAVITTDDLERALDGAS